MPCRLLFTAFVVALTSPSLFAANVEYRLVFSEVEGAFQLFASASLEDNAGIASYGVALAGPITGLNHISPYTTEAENSAMQPGAAGFSLLRSPDSGFTVHASQDLIMGTPHLIYGVGQSGGSFAGLGLTSQRPIQTSAWDGEILLASGTYDAGLGLPSIDYANDITSACLFREYGATSVIAADIIGKPQRAPLSPSPDQAPNPPSPPNDPPVLLPHLPATPFPTEATVRYRIDTTETGEFKLYASANLEGHAGIALYAVSLTGGVTSVDHVSPATMSAENAALESGTAGFTLLRSEDGNTWVHASQDAINPTPHILYGIGQASGSLAQAQLTATSPVEGDEWGADVLLATGRFDATLGNIGIDYSSTFANVFNSTGDISTRVATIIPDPNLITVPPPIDPLPPTPPPIDPGPTPEPPQQPVDPTLPEPEHPPFVELPPQPEPESPTPPPLDPPDIDVPPEIIVIDGLINLPYIDFGQWKIWRYGWDEDGVTLNLVDLVHGDGLEPIDLGAYLGGAVLYTSADVQLAGLQASIASHRSALGQTVVTTASASASEALIPEPSTAALSILALLPLLARNRKK